MYPKPDDVPSIKADQNLKVDELAAMTTSYTAMNTTRKYMSDVRVRKAINIAFDKPTYVTSLYGKGNAVIGTVPYPPTLLGFNDKLKKTHRATLIRPVNFSRKRVYRKVPC